MPHHEVVECPDRSVFAPATARKWHAMATMIPSALILPGTLDQRVREVRPHVTGRFVVPLTLVRPEAYPGLDMEAGSYLVGRSWQGGVLQVQVWKWVKGKGPMAVTHAEDPGEAVRSRDYPNLFLLVREWRDVSAKGVPHPVLGPMTVRVNPRLVDTPQGRRFESDPEAGVISLDESPPVG